jgi:CDP-6-deoxy-D-xylo-4-hexulose-3-dehydrase
MNKKQVIIDFINQVKKEQFIPEYCHNLKGVRNKVFYSGPLMDDDELVEAIDSLLFGKWFSSGEKVYKFEQEFSKKINQKYSVMVNSGSSANLVMIAALKKHFKWVDTDEILLSVVGFPTTLNPIIQNNLKPVFVDIEYNTLNFDLDELIKKITLNTKAIFVSPVLGNPPDMDRLIEIAKTHKLEIIMDGCDSFGSKWKGKDLCEYAVATS